MLRRVRRTRGDKGCSCVGCSQTFTTRTRTKAINLEDKFSSLKKQVEFMRNRNRKRFSRKCVSRVDKKCTQKQTKMVSRKLNTASRTRRQIGKKTTSSPKMAKVDRIHIENKNNTPDSDLSLRIEAVFSLAGSKTRGDRSIIFPEVTASLSTPSVVEQEINKRLDKQNDISGTYVLSGSKPNIPSCQTPQFFLLPLGSKNVLIPTGKLSGNPTAYVFDSRLSLESITENICSSVSRTVPREESSSITSSDTSTNRTTKSASVSFTSSHSPSMTASAHHADGNVYPSLSGSEHHGEKSCDSEFLLGTHQLCKSSSHNVTRNNPVRTNSEERIHKLKETLRLQHEAVERFRKKTASGQFCF